MKFYCISIVVTLQIPEMNTPSAKQEQGSYVAIASYANYIWLLFAFACKLRSYYYNVSVIHCRS